MNPMAMMKIKPLLESFAQNHPKFPAFISTAANGVDVGGTLEMKVTNSAGQKLSASIKLNEQDIELIRELRELLSAQL